MKLSILGLGMALANLVAGAVLPRGDSTCGNDELKRYKFLVESDNTELDGRYLSTGSGEDSVGLYSAANKHPDYVAYSIASPVATPTQDLIELHAWPIGIVDHVFCVQRLGGSPLWFIMDELASFSDRKIESIYQHWQIKDGYLTYQFPYPYSNPDDTVWYLYQYAPDPTTYTLRWNVDGTYGPGYFPIKIKVVEHCDDWSSDDSYTG